MFCEDAVDREDAVTSPRSLADLRQRLRQFRLLDDDQLAEVERSPLPPDELARDLLQRDWLTAYQLNQLALPHPDHLVIGPYAILGRVGEGAMGTIFKARHRILHRVVALKVIRKKRLVNPRALQRFRLEVQAASRLLHPNIVRVFDADEDPETHTHFMAMEFVDGIDLGKLVRQRGPLGVSLACDFIRQAALGLQHAHECGLIHRDVKPANLLLSISDGVVKILDLGLVRLAGPDDAPSSVTLLGAVVGTPGFMSPEQAIDPSRIDFRTDIYALGCSLYFLLTGRPPFDGKSVADILIQHQSAEAPPLSSLNPEVSPDLEHLVRRMMAKRPDDRPASCAEVAALLEPFCPPPPVPALPVAMPLAVPVALPLRWNAPWYRGQVLPLVRAVAVRFLAHSLLFVSNLIEEFVRLSSQPDDAAARSAPLPSWLVDSNDDHRSTR